MYNSKLYSILEYFSKYEQNRCRKYITSPYFNRNKGIIRLFDYLVEKLNEKGPEEPELDDKMVIWQKIGESKEYDDVRFRKYCSDLLKLVEGFLAQEMYEENPLHQATYLIEAVGRRKMAQLQNSTSKSVKRLTSRQVHRPASYYFYQYQIEKTFYEQFRAKRAEVTNIEAVTLNLDRFYLAEKLKYYCEIMSHQYEGAHRYEILFIEEIIHHVEMYNYDEVPPIAVYYQIYLAMVDGENHEHYYKLKDLLSRYGLEFPTEEAFNAYTFAINYCTRQINKGSQQFLQEYFDLYKDLLEKRIIFVEGELPTAHFKNIATVGLRLGKIDWIDQFIKEYQFFLPQEHRESAVSFNLAQLYFYKKDYDKVIELLQFIEYEDLTYNLNAKLTLLVTYYEIDEIEALYSLLESFRVYLKRNKNVTARRRRSYLNLIRFVRKLSRILPGDEKALSKIKSEMQETREIVMIKWLQEKIVELER